LLPLYFIPGVLGQMFGYLWSPNTAGSSLGIVGVIGGLFAFALLHRQEVSRVAQLFAICGIAEAVVLCLWRDIHGPPTVLGVLLASMMTILWPGTARSSTDTSDAANIRKSEG
jgi:membrane associated rhomboid family serine protease